MEGPLREEASDLQVQHHLGTWMRGILETGLGWIMTFGCPELGLLRVSLGGVLTLGLEVS